MQLQQLGVRRGVLTQVFVLWVAQQGN